MSRGVAIVLGACVLGPLLAGCSGSGPRSTTPTSGPTPIAALDVASMHVARVQFCDRIADSAVRRALAGKPEGDSHWGNGDPLPTGDTGARPGDVTHELGCAWTGAAGAAARAWVFARPTTADFAQTLVADAGNQPGCKAEPATEFGSPALLQTCALPAGVERVRRAGLFTDSWLTCELSGPASADLRARTDGWCAAVVSAVQATGR